MKFSSPTQLREMKRCPRRYYYRYLFLPQGPIEAAVHESRRQLYGVRELGGHVIHESLAEMVRDVAAGAGKWCVEEAARSCLKHFDLVVERSLATPAGVLLAECQLAESYNGVARRDIESQAEGWRNIIPRAIENGRKAGVELRIPRASAMVNVEAEKVITYERSFLRTRNILDVLISSPHRARVIDWKARRSLEDIDIAGVRRHMSFLHKVQGRDILSLSGWLVNLLTGEVEEVKYNPYRSTDHQDIEECFPQFGISRTKGPPTFEPAPHPELCSRCPYADLCDASLAGPTNRLLDPLPFRGVEAHAA